MKNKKLLFLFTATLLLALGLSGCISTRPEPAHISRDLRDKGIKTSGELYEFFRANNSDPAIQKTAKLMAKLYVKEAEMEGINSDCAFVQMCLETGFLRFGGLVTPDMHNYCGLGAIDAEHRGVVYDTEQQGVRAHIQHLHAYAYTEDIPLKNECIDPRYKWVNPKGKAPTIFGLTKTWAADPEYGDKLDALLTRLETF